MQAVGLIFNNTKHTMQTITSILQNNKFTVAGVAIGALAGYLYWSQIGCATGTCAITSVWYRSTVYFAVMGGLFGNILRPAQQKEG